MGGLWFGFLGYLGLVLVFFLLSFLFCGNRSLFCRSSLKEEFGWEQVGYDLHVFFGNARVPLFTCCP